MYETLLLASLFKISTWPQVISLKKSSNSLKKPISKSFRQVLPTEPSWQSLKERVLKSQPFAAMKKPTVAEPWSFLRTTGKKMLHGEISPSMLSTLKKMEKFTILGAVLKTLNKVLSVSSGMPIGASKKIICVFYVIFDFMRALPNTLPMTRR